MGENNLIIYRVQVICLIKIFMYISWSMVNIYYKNIVLLCISLLLLYILLNALNCMLDRLGFQKWQLMWNPLTETTYWKLAWKDFMENHHPKRSNSTRVFKLEQITSQTISSLASTLLQCIRIQTSGNNLTIKLSLKKKCAQILKNEGDSLLFPAL